MQNYRWSHDPPSNDVLKLWPWPNQNVPRNCILHHISVSHLHRKWLSPYIGIMSKAILDKLAVFTAFIKSFSYCYLITSSTIPSVQVKWMFHLRLKFFLMNNNFAESMSLCPDVMGTPACFLQTCWSVTEQTTFKLRYRSDNNNKIARIDEESRQ